MSEQNDGGIRLDPKFLGLLTFLVTQLGVAVWWAGEKNAEVTHLQSDLTILTNHLDKQMDRMENKIDDLANRGMPAPR
jgi:hypothetical protein